MTQNNADASAVSEGEMTANALLEALGTTLEPDLLVEALTHRSFSHENPGAKNYERLEFLGDAVLELVSTETLYKAHPDMNEGQLAKMRAKAVSEEEAEKAGFTDQEESTAEEESSSDSTLEEDSTLTESEADSTEERFSDGSEDAKKAGTAVIDTSQQLTGTYHAANIKDSSVCDYGSTDNKPVRSNRSNDKRGGRRSDYAKCI